MYVFFVDIEAAKMWFTKMAASFYSSESQGGKTENQQLKKEHLETMPTTYILFYSVALCETTASVTVMKRNKINLP